MEYELPRAPAWPALREAIALDSQERAAGDVPVRVPLGRPATISGSARSTPGPARRSRCTSTARWRGATLFAEGEPIFRAHGGRPHWAKRHTLTARDVDTLYPKAARFRAVRAQVDPAASSPTRTWPRCSASAAQAGAMFDDIDLHRHLIGSQVRAAR